MKKVLFAAALSAVVAAPAVATEPNRAPSVPGQMIVYQGKNFTGQSIVVERERASIRTRWNMGSILIHPGERWELCNKVRFNDPCMVLDRSVPDAEKAGLNAQLGSARPAAN